MIRSFADRGSEDIFNRHNSKEARQRCPRHLWPIARRKMDQLNAAVSLQSLKIPPGNRLEALRGKRRGQHSVRINDQYRICFVWDTKDVGDVEIVDYH